MIEWFERVTYLICGIGLVLLSFTLMYFLYVIIHIQQQSHKSHSEFIEDNKWQRCAIVDDGDNEEWKNAIRSAKSL